MNVVVVASIISVVGAAVAVVLVMRLVGFRPAGGIDLAKEAALPEGDLERQIAELHASVVELRELIVEKEMADDDRWQAYREETRQLRDMVRRTRFEVDKRLRDSDESRQQREREQARHREREQEQSRWQQRQERRFVSS
ncbi:MAG: hypothetical protein JJE35_09695 [Thermoleophilia bacterium]|nr:hypothetical protein [Thermoleophilia bacterium]